MTFQTTETNSTNQFLEFDGYIDLGKELSVLHSLLTESLEKCNQVLHLNKYCHMHVQIFCGFFFHDLRNISCLIKKNQQ